MYELKRISKVYELSEQIPFDDSSRIVLMSDCHRGDGSWADDFSKNQSIYAAALNHYYKENFTYIELGDGDELWKNKKFSDIIKIHGDVFSILVDFHKKQRLYFIFGNHDMVKKNKKFVQNNLFYYFNEREKKNVPLFEDVKVHEGLVLNHTDTGNKIFLIHGHQVDYLNDGLWRFSRFLVRYIWNPLELFGFNDPTSAAKNYRKKQVVGGKLADWAEQNNCMLISGHTHRPTFPEPGEIPYFNDGSCVHPRCITAIEIDRGSIMLVKWEVKIRNDGSLFVGREILAGPERLEEYFKQRKDGCNSNEGNLQKEQVKYFETLHNAQEDKHKESIPS